MSTFQELRTELQNERTSLLDLENKIYDHRQQEQIIIQEIKARQKWEGTFTPLEMESEWQRRPRLSNEMEELEASRQKIKEIEAAIDQLGNTSGLITHWNDELPVLLLPLKVHTRFVKVKHLTKAKKAYILDYDRPAAENVLGISAEHNGKIQQEWPEILDLSFLNSAGNADQKKLGHEIRAEIKKGLAGDRSWLKPVDDTYELLIRIYPDDIFVHGHEEYLRLQELEDGKRFWEKCWEIETKYKHQELDETERDDQLIAAWKVLQDEYLPSRAAFIYEKLKPLNYPSAFEEAEVDEPEFNEKEIPIKAQSWSRPKRSYLLPDRFVVRLYHGGVSRVARPPEEIEGKRIVYPLALSHDPLRASADAGSIPDEIKWITDFEAAEKIGMAIRVPLSVQAYHAGIDKLVVLGVNLSMDEKAGKVGLESLLHNHQYQTEGLGFIPQGTPTNNFENKRSGYNFFGPPAEQFFPLIHHHGTGTKIPLHWTEKTDAHFLTEQLGIDLETIRKVYGADKRDISGAMAMNHVLWPATLGYYLQQFFQPLLKDKEVKAVRRFFQSFVSGRGFLPAIHVGSQPYSILTTSAYSTFTWPKVITSFSRELYENVLIPLDAHWDSLVKNVKHLFNLHTFKDADGQPYAIHKYAEPFVEMLGLQASSETFFQRPVPGAFFLWNTYRAHFPSGEADIVLPGFDAGTGYLDKWPIPEIWGGPGKPDYFPPHLAEDFRRLFPKLANMGKKDLLENRIFQLHFPLDYGLLEGSFVDKLPPSPDRQLSVLEKEGKNYLKYLMDLKAKDLEQLFQAGSNGNSTLPKSNGLLYLLARQAVARAYLDTAIDHFLPFVPEGYDLRALDFELEHLEAGDDFGKEQRERLRANGIRYWQDQDDSEYRRSKWKYLEGRSDAIDASLEALLRKIKQEEIEEPLVEMGEHTDPLIHLAKSKLSLQVLSELSTESLQLLLSEHLDLCNYRLDAWMQGVVNERLFAQRKNRPEGIYLGAYAYLENLRLSGGEAVIYRKLETPEFVTRNNIAGPINEIIPVLNLRSLADHQLDLEAILSTAWIYLGRSYETKLEVNPRDKSSLVASPIVPSENQGFMHTPSRDHAVAAAILRSGYMANNPTEAHGAFAINLSSKRVRNALYLIEGVKNGQELSALLGYQLERGLHDHPQGPLNKFISQIRKHFPLRAGKLSDLDTSKPIETQEASNVPDGIAVVKMYRTLPKGNALYWADIQTSLSAYELSFTNTGELQSFMEVLDQLSQSLDTVGDLFLSESVFQVARGNLNQAAVALKMFDNEVELDTPEIIKTPRKGKLLSHLAGVHFDTTETQIAWPGVLTPRSFVNPQLNHWLAGQLPRPSRICINVQLSTGSVHKIKLSEISWIYRGNSPRSIDPISLQPIDLIALFQGKNVLSEASDLSWLIRLSVQQKFPEEALDTMKILYKDRKGFGKTQLSIYEVQPLIQTLISLLSQGRPMLPNDLQRDTATDTAAENAMPTLDNSRLIKRLEAIVEGTSPWSIHRYKSEANNFGYRLRRARDPNFSEADAQVSYHNLQDMLARNELYNFRGSFYHVGAAYALESREALLDQAVAAKAYFTKLEKEAKDRLTEIKNIPDRQDQWKEIDALLKRIFGEDFMVFPEFTLANPDEYKAAFDFPDLLSDTGAFAVEEWLQGLAQVRKPLKTYQRLNQFRSILNLRQAEKQPKIIQLPVAEDPEQYRWLGVAFPENIRLNGDVLSLALEIPDSYQTNGLQSGMVIDTWKEEIPDQENTTGIAMHYDQPNSEAPQLMLLCVTPEQTGFWELEDLFSTIIDTMHMAKKRGIDPDIIAQGPDLSNKEGSSLKYFLPAVLAPVCYNGHTPWVDFGINNLQPEEQS